MCDLIVSVPDHCLSFYFAPVTINYHLCLNVCGIVSKLNSPEFISLIQTYDSIGVQETETDNYDTLHFPCYKVFLKTGRVPLKTVQVV